MSCLGCDDEEKGKLPWLWADAGCSASWWGVDPPVSGSPCLPPLSCGESDRWSPKVLLLSQCCFFSPAPPRTGLKAPGNTGNTGTALGPQPSAATRVNCLQSGVALPPPSPTNTLLPPCGCRQQLHPLSERRHFFTQTKHVLSRSLSTLSFEMIKTGGFVKAHSTLGEGERRAKLDMLYILM